MTTAVQSKPVPKPATAPAQQKPVKEIKNGPVPINSISVVSNIRKMFKQAQMDELTDNIMKVGVLEPILLRPSPSGSGYLLIAGERRLRAAKDAGLKEIPGRVLEVTNEQAAEIQAFENLHREGLTPMEEARTFKMLLEAGKYSVDQLAQRVDKSKVYVYRAVSLLNLPKVAIDKIESGKWTPAHGHQVLRVPAGNREQLIKDWLDDQYDDDTAKAFQEYIDGKVGKTLSNALFPKDKEYAGKIACTACPLNTGNQGALFDGAVKGKCTGPDCFESKNAFYVKETIEKAKAAALKLGFQWLGEGQAQGYGSDLSFKGNAILSAEEAKKAKDSKKFAAAYATFQYNGDRNGMIIVRLKTEEQKKAEAKQRAVSSPKADPKGDFISAEVDKEFGREIVRVVRKNPLEAARSIATYELENMYGDKDSLFEILGVKNKAELDKKVKGSKSTEELIAIILLAEGVENGEYEFEAGNAGADMKTVRKTATAAAEKAWALKNPAASKA